MKTEIPSKKKRPRSCILVGAGHRTLLYASYALSHPDELEVVGVADPVPLRREQAVKTFGLSSKRCFASADELADRPRLADFVINGTMDHQHVPTALPLLERGYDMLLEKPIATHEEELWSLVAAAGKYGNRIAICHVLRHTPFYSAIRKRVADGEIGDIINVQAVEHVSYHHMAVGYVRGKWNNTEACHSSMLMAKSCHDLDLLAWMKSGLFPRRVASFGGNFQFAPEKAPPRAGTRCLVDCPIEPDCLYSARKHYLDHPHRWAFYVWDSLEHKPNPTRADKLESLQTSPYGKCVWKTDMNGVDHQSVLVEFEDGATATLNMIGGCAKPSRSIHLVGTLGEIQGCMEESRFVIRHIDPRPGKEFSETTQDLNVTGDMSGARGGHGGGDMRLVADFLDLLNGKRPSISTTRLEDSIAGHVIGFRADKAMRENKIIEIDMQKLMRAHLAGGSSGIHGNPL